ERQLAAIAQERAAWNEERTSWNNERHDWQRRQLEWRQQIADWEARLADQVRRMNELHHALAAVLAEDHVSVAREDAASNCPVQEHSVERPSIGEPWAVADAYGESPAEPGQPLGSD